MENSTTPQVPVATPAPAFVPGAAQASGQYPVMPAFREVIGDGYQAVKEIKAIKPGYKTTEFWLTLVFNAVTVVAVIVPADSQSAKIAGLLASALSLFGYSASRGLAKSV